MKSKKDFSIAINQVINLIKQRKETEKIDMELFANDCVKEFRLIDLPFFGISVNPNDANRISIETPFMRSCHIQIVQKIFPEKQKKATLFVNGAPVRTIPLEDTNPEYMKRVAHALLDYLKRYLLLKNKYTSK